jgi:hypothetical protein
MKKRQTSLKIANDSRPIFINVPISAATRDGLQFLKAAMNVHNQADVIEKLVSIGVAISQASGE